MERPDCLDPLEVLATPIPRDAPPAPPGQLDLGSGLKIFAWAQLAILLSGALGFALAVGLALSTGITPLVAAQYAVALSASIGGLLALGIVFSRLERRAPLALRDRSVHGCAWYGASDEVVAQAFLLGGGLAVALALLGTAVEAPDATAAPRFSEWQLLPAMSFAFATIAIAPVAEELLVRGVLFAAVRRRLSTPGAGVVVTVTFALMHYPQLVARPSSVIAFLALGAIALALRLRHAALAPAIALHCGYNFTVCVMAALA